MKWRMQTRMRRRSRGCGVCIYGVPSRVLRGRVGGRRHRQRSQGWVMKERCLQRIWMGKKCRGFGSPRCSRLGCAKSENYVKGTRGTTYPSSWRYFPQARHISSNIVEDWDGGVRVQLGAAMGSSKGTWAYIGPRSRHSQRKTFFESRNDSIRG